MDQANIVMTKVRALDLPKLEVETNEHKKYVADFSDFKSVYCFPKSQSEWETVGITGQGFNLTWKTRFEVHVDQVIDSAKSVKFVKLQA